MKRLLFVIICIAYVITSQSQDFAIKTNTLFWATTTMNAGLEASLNNKYTIELDLAYNPWTFKDDKKMKFILAQPSVKYWFCEKFEGHFVGVHIHGAQYYGGFKDKRYDGYLAGGGISYGYDWILSPHWNLEAEIGIGYARLWYKQSPRIPCTKCYRNKHSNYVGPTRLALAFTYIF